MKTKEELQIILKEYEGIISKKMYDYLLDIINLKYSVMRDDKILLSNKNHLKEIEIYKDCSVYNIYKRAQNIINHEVELDLISYEDYPNFDYSIFSIGGFNAFEFDYGNSPMLNDGDFAKVSLYHYLTVEQELKRINKELDKLKYEQNMFDSTSSSFEKNMRMLKYNSLKAKYNKLLRNENNTDILNAINLVNNCYDILANDYALESKKCLVIRKPGISIEQHINHIL